MKLLIVESPAKAKTIEKYLGEDYLVKASVGHIRDLPKSNKQAIDIKNGFVPNYEIVKAKEKTVKELKQFAKKAKEVILATDLDREGEAIAWHVAEILELKNPKRIVFNESPLWSLGRTGSVPFFANYYGKRARNQNFPIRKIFCS